MRCEAGQDTWTAATFCGGNSISHSNDWASSGSSSWPFGGDVCLGNVSINSFVERCWPLMTALIPLPLRLAQDDVSIYSVELGPSSASVCPLPGINKSNQLATINNTNSERSANAFHYLCYIFQRYFI